MPLVKQANTKLPQAGFFASTHSNLENLHKMKIHFLYHTVNKMKLVLLRVQILKKRLLQKKQKAENAEKTLRKVITSSAI